MGDEAGPPTWATKLVKPAAVPQKDAATLLGGFLSIAPRSRYCCHSQRPKKVMATAPTVRRTASSVTIAAVSQPIPMPTSDPGSIDFRMPLS